LIFYPGNEEIKNYLASANESYEKLKRNEYLTPLNLPQNYEEIIDAEVEKCKERGMNVSKKKLVELLTNHKDRGDVITAYQYRFGTNKIKKDLKTELKLFPKAAQKGNTEAMYSLAQIRCLQEVKAFSLILFKLLICLKVLLTNQPLKKINCLI